MNKGYTCWQFGGCQIYFPGGESNSCTHGKNDAHSPGTDTGKAADQSKRIIWGKVPGTIDYDNRNH